MNREENDNQQLKFHVFRDERFIDLNLYQFGWEKTGPGLSLIHISEPTRP